MSTEPLKKHPDCNVEEQDEETVIVRTESRLDAEEMTPPPGSEDKVRAIIPADETDGMEQNRAVVEESLEDAGFGLVRTRMLSDLTMMLHTGTLPDDQQDEFEAWASEQGYEQLDGDRAGDLWRVNI